MKLGVFTVLFGTKPFEEMLDFVVELGLDAVEGPVVAVVSGGNVDPADYGRYLATPLPG